MESIVLFFRIRSLGRLRDRLKGSHVQHDHVDVPRSEQKRHLSGEDETMRHTKSAIADDDDMYITAYVDHETNNSAENMPTSK